MYMPGGSTNQYSQCCNAYRLDNGEGFEVCVECGKVLQELLDHEIVKYYKVDYHSELRDICENLNISSGVQYQAELIMNNMHNLRADDQVVAIAYSVFMALAIEKCPHPQSDIEDYLELSPGAIMKFAKRYNQNIIMPAYDDYIDPYFNKLNIPHQMKTKAMNIIRKFPRVESRPGTVVAAAICQLKEVSAQELDHISKECHTTSSTVRQFLKKHI